MLIDFENSGLDINSQKLKMCEFETHSGGLLIQHKVTVHSIKESKQNIILGYEFHVQRHFRVFELMEEGLDNFKCGECGFKIHSEGKFEINKLTSHQG